MFLTFKKWTALYILCLIAIFVVFGLILRQGNAVQTSAAALSEESLPVLIIDPGHGGEDGGAVANDGTVESGINLSVALMVEDLARLAGWDTVMTRREDISIHDEGSETIREKKNSDLRNRVALCNSVEGGILISIHQNSLPSVPSVHGAQVFYNGVGESEFLAQAIQDELNRSVNGASGKEIKRTGDNIYLMANVTCPAVLVECGFLSNPQEAELLKTQDYQTKLAMAILAGVDTAMGSAEK